VPKWRDVAGTPVMIERDKRTFSRPSLASPPSRPGRFPPAQLIRQRGATSVRAPTMYAVGWNWPPNVNTLCPPSRGCESRRATKRCGAVGRCELACVSARVGDAVRAAEQVGVAGRWLLAG